MGDGLRTVSGFRLLQVRTQRFVDTRRAAGRVGAAGPCRCALHALGMGRPKTCRFCNVPNASLRRSPKPTEELLDDQRIRSADCD